MPNQTAHQAAPLADQLRREASTLVHDLADALAVAIAQADERPALPPGADAALAVLDEPLPDRGEGARQALEQLLDLQARAGTNTAGPRCYHFVIGGNTPAAHGADLVAAAFDVLTYTWVTSPVGVRMELQALEWLKQLLGIPAGMHGLMVTGATMANFVGMAAARQWWGEELGFDVSETGLAGQPPMPVISTGFLHAASRKVLSLLGVGRANITQVPDGPDGGVDLDAFTRALEQLGGAPALVVVNAGEVNAGHFDPVAAMIDIARRHRCWVHVDGAFGLFAALSPRTAHLVAGFEGADSITVDGHKWLNVPYDSGYAFVRDHGLMARAFRYSADYLPDEDDPRPTLGAIGPESSRRGRGFAVWATLKAYGRDGHRQIVEHCLDIAQHFARVVDHTPGLERMADVPLNIVAFRYNPGGLDEAELDALNQRLGEAVIEAGEFLVGTSKLGERTIFRPAFSNWRTRREDVEALAGHIVRLGQGLN
ncbi:aspartate aminotransferase family protein [Marinihelvus fidelis]|uniref:Aspartate aminotransferase family protein n=1 Tax=Marinihelvus fidelis TaxID=2613842 RepID=A0A5N0TE08_9GAMM|nr:pyridoxal-dependent decarboxylase [Marinihelvus fidelis]KAA9133333.1 aspartate aminotransferase family protein [Marinihelvus fidelis]